MKPGRTVAIVLLLLAALAFLALGPGGRPAGRAAVAAGETAGVLTILSPHWEGIREECERAYNEERTRRGELPVRFDWLDVGGSSDVIRYVRTSFGKTPEGIGVDLLFGGGTDPYITLDREGLLQRCELPEEILGALGKTVGGVPVFDSNQHWFGVGLSGFGILYNRVLLGKLGISEPESWSDLARPECFSWVASADPRKSGSVFMMYEIMVQAYGWERGMEIISAISGNTRSFSSSASAIVKDVALGEAAFGLCIDVYGLNAIMEAGEDRLGFLLPPGETVISPDAIAILKGAPSPDLAADFVAFTLSERGQKLWAFFPGEDPDGPREHALLKMSVREDLYDKYPGAPMLKTSPFRIRQKFAYDMPAAQGRFGIFRDYLGILFVDQRGECAAAWRRVSALPPEDPRRKLFFNHPQPDPAAFIALGLGDYKEPAKRAAIQAEWANDARSRYRAAAAAEQPK